jgi:flagellar basal body-associated protein FliL
MSESPAPNNEPAMQSNAPKNGNKKILYIVLGVAAFCLFCCAALLIGQYFLENSDFSLVYSGRLIV